MPTAEKFLNTTGLTYFFNRLKTIFVQKEEGKGLSSNDYTTAEKTKLTGIATGAEVNQNAYSSITFSKWVQDQETSEWSEVIETVPAGSKTADLRISIGDGLYEYYDQGDGTSSNPPTVSLSTELNSAEYYDSISGYYKIGIAGPGTARELTRLYDAPSDTVDSVVNSHKQGMTRYGITTALNAKAPLASPALTGTPTAPTATAGTNTTQIATTAFVKDAVDTAIGQMTGLSFEVVQTLPATGAAGTIYLVPNSGTAPNVYDEYIYYGSTFEKIGTTDVDLSSYYNTSSLVAITTAEIDTITA